MYGGKTVGVVVPVYNEAAFVGDVIDTVPPFVDRVYVVDDRSTDGSWAEVTRRADLTVGAAGRERSPTAPAASVDPLADGGIDAPSPGRVVAVRHDVNRGRGGAVKTGYRLALADGLDVVAVMDGDGQMDPDVLDRIVDPVVEGSADYAKGNRLVDPDHWTSMSGWRLFGNTCLTVLTRIASGYWGMRDPQNGYTAISTEALERLDLADLYDDYGFLNDLLVALNVHGMRVVDVPMRAVYGEESSGIEYSSFVPNLSALLLRRFVWRLWRKYVRRPRPGNTVAGAVTLWSEGSATTVSSVVSSSIRGLPAIEIPAIAAIACLLIGAVVSAVGIVRLARVRAPGNGAGGADSDPDDSTDTDTDTDIDTDTDRQRRRVRHRRVRPRPATRHP